MDRQERGDARAAGRQGLEDQRRVEAGHAAPAMRFADIDRGHPQRRRLAQGRRPENARSRPTRSALGAMRSSAKDFAMSRTAIWSAVKANMGFPGFAPLARPRRVPDVRLGRNRAIRFPGAARIKCHAASSVTTGAARRTYLQAFASRRIGRWRSPRPEALIFRRGRGIDWPRIVAGGPELSMRPRSFAFSAPSYIELTASSGRK